MTRNEFAAAINVNPVTISAWVRDGKLAPSLRFGDRFGFTADQIAEGLALRDARKMTALPPAPQGEHLTLDEALARIRAVEPGRKRISAWTLRRWIDDGIITPYRDGLKRILFPVALVDEIAARRATRGPSPRRVPFGMSSHAA